MILVCLQTASSRQPPSLLLRCVGPPARLRFGVYSLGVLQSRCNGAAPLGTPSVLLGARRTDPAPLSERGRAGTGCTAQGGAGCSALTAVAPSWCRPPFPSPSGAAVPEQLLVQVRGCARPRRLPGLVAELLSFRHGVQAGGGRQGWLASGPPCGKAGGERGGGRIPLFAGSAHPHPYVSPTLGVLVLLPMGSGKPWVNGEAWGCRAPLPGQAVPKCPPAPGSGCWHRWPCRASPVSQGGCGGQSHLHPDLQRGREQQPGGCSQGGGDAATCIGATPVPSGGQGQLGQGVGPVASRWSTRDSSCLWPGSVV